MLATTVGKQGTSKKNCFKFKEILKKKDDKDTDETSTSETSEQVDVVEEAYENPCDVLIAQSEKRKYSDAWLLGLRCTYHMYLKREWFSTYKRFDGGSILMGNDVVCKAVGIGNIL